MANTKEKCQRQSGVKCVHQEAKKQAGVKTENPTLDDPHVVDGSIF